MSISNNTFPCNYQEAVNQHLQGYPENDSIRRTWEIGASALSGRGIFTKQSITKGELIFIDDPILLGPRSDCADKKFCSNCYKTNTKAFNCSLCDLLVCSEGCNVSSNHKKVCEFITENWHLNDHNNKSSEVLQKNLIMINALHLQKEELLLMTELQMSSKKDLKYELEALLKIYNVSQEHVLRMQLIQSLLEINSFRIPCDQQGSLPMRGLYPVSSFLNHSCTPNIRYTFRYNRAMAVYATMDIEEGQELLICYTGLLWGTPARRHQLFKSKGFWCNCTRCSNPTEFGTRLSALKCLNRECVGVLLPTHPLNNRSNWQCDNCEVKVTPVQVSAVQSALGSLLGTLDLDSNLQLEGFVLERLATLAPFSSHVFVDLKFRLATKLGFLAGFKLSGNINKLSAAITIG